MTTLKSRSLVASGAVLASLLSAVVLSACQDDGWSLGVMNMCDAPIDAWTFDSPDPGADQYRIDWMTIQPHEGNTLWSSIEREQDGHDYLWVRSADSTETPAPVRVPPSQTVKDRGSRLTYTVVSGELCP